MNAALGFSDEIAVMKGLGRCHEGWLYVLALLSILQKSMRENLKKDNSLTICVIIPS
jgi:hypothetical protein